MATHSSVLAWRIPGTGEPGGLLSMGSRRVRHDWSDLAAAAALWSPKPNMITPAYYSDSSSCHIVSFSQESSRRWLSCSFLNMLFYAYLRVFPLTLPFAWLSLPLGFLPNLLRLLLRHHFKERLFPTILSKLVPLSYSHNQFYFIFITLTIFCYMFVYGLSPRSEYKTSELRFCLWSIFLALTTILRTNQRVTTISAPPLECTI